MGYWQVGEVGGGADIWVEGGELVLSTGEGSGGQGIS